MFMKERPSVIACTVLFVICAVGNMGCGGMATENGTSAIPSTTQSASMQATLDDQQIQIVRQTFPRFQSERVALGVNPTNRGALVPSNFSPALFFGSTQGGAQNLTSGGIPFVANGYDDQNIVPPLPLSGTYFDPQKNMYSISLSQFQVSPLNKLEARMSLPPSPAADMIMIDRGNPRVTAFKIETTLRSVQLALSQKFPQVMNVDLRNCEIVIEPTIFYVTMSNFGNSWAVGMTESLGQGKYRIHVSVFYISSQRVIVDWQTTLIDEAINFFVLSIGRGDLAI
ncbi:MAG: hypothetical protein HY046_10870 [Acidobacteria bacterium]|nr:hypothetical protein [Acidobacteriota bacterium]